MDFDVQKARFDRICAHAMRQRHSMGEDGVGTLSEKRMHAVIKHWLCADESCHEVRLEGTRFVSDVRVGKDVYEVQTGHFYPMKKKIAHYLEQTDLTVTVVHPVSVMRWMCWIDPVTAEITPRKRVARRQKKEDILALAYELSPYLNHPRLRFCVLELETQEFRMLGKNAKDPKRDSHRYESVPIALLAESHFDSPADFSAFLPPTLTGCFTVKEFSAQTGIKGRDAYSAVRALCAFELLKPTNPIGKSMAFERVKPS